MLLNLLFTTLGYTLTNLLPYALIGLLPALIITKKISDAWNIKY